MSPARICRVASTAVRSIMAAHARWRARSVSGVISPVGQVFLQPIASPLPSETGLLEAAEGSGRIELAAVQCDGAGPELHRRPPRGLSVGTPNRSRQPV